MTVGDFAFDQCSSLTSISISDNTMNIGKDVFSGTAFYFDEANWDNESLYLGNILLEPYTFDESPVEIKDGTKSIANYAFSYYDYLEIIIPDSVMNICENTYYESLDVVIYGNAGSYAETYA